MNKRKYLVMVVGIIDLECEDGKRSESLRGISKLLVVLDFGFRGCCYSDLFCNKITFTHSNRSINHVKTTSLI